MPWKAKLSQLNAALVGASVADRQIGERIRERLVRAGKDYDRYWPDGNGPGPATESGEHAQWRADAIAAANDLDQIARLIDGKPPGVYSEPSKALAQARQRLQSALFLGVTGALQRLAMDALKVYFTEPPFYGFVRRDTSTVTDSATRLEIWRQNARVDLAEAMADVDLWLTTVP